MPTVTKLDLKALHLDTLYNPPKTFTIVDVPPLNVLAIDGEGDPNTSQVFKDAVSALYSVSYPVKFMCKKEMGVDYKVMPLEGLWWAGDLAVYTKERQADLWQWTLLIVQPEPVTREMVDRAIREAGQKKDLPALPRLRFETFHEGLCVQIMYLGPYSGEGPTIHQMHHEFIPQNNLVERGRHHEIYLGDPSRAAPEKLKTILRHPVDRR